MYQSVAFLKESLCDPKVRFKRKENLTLLLQKTNRMGDLVLV